MKVPIVCLGAVLALAVLGLGSASSVDRGPVAPEGDLSAHVLNHPSIRLLPGARTDVERGMVDRRILHILLLLADRNQLTVGPLVTDHSYYVKGTTRPSNHAFGRAVDITVIAGAPVSLQNAAALEAVRVLGSLPPPNEIGCPWPLRLDGIRMLVKDHGDHLHVAHDA